MKKLLITGDWQLDSQPAFDQINPETSRSTRFDENVETLEGLIDAAMAAGADGMVHLGDLTENRNPKAVEMEAAAHLFARFMREGFHVWGIAGNHDGAFFDVSSSSFAPLAAMRAEQFTLFHNVAYEPTLRMLAIPYIHRATPAEIKALVAAAYPDGMGPRPVFAAIHYGLQGCVVGARNLVLPGDYLGPDELLVKPLDHIFAGHIHKAQELAIGSARGWHPGSPVICDMGERDDRKTYILFDTITRTVEVKDIPQRRRWLSIPYSPELAGAIWGPDDLVKITGTYEKPDYPKATVEAAFKAGKPRPFALEVEVKPAKVERAMRSLSVTSAGGLRDALQAYVREKYPRFGEEPGLIGPATAAALAALQEQGGLKYCDEVFPTSITISNFMTFIAYEGAFMHGTPMLVAGENGVGKTNYFEAILWVLTGKTSKGLDLAGVVRQGCQDAEVALFLQGQSAETAESVFRITRAVKLSKGGKASAKLTLEAKDPVSGEWAKTLSDGSQADVQGRIDSLVGGSYLTLRTTAFKFQNDTSPFIRCHPSDRKAVIGEVTGLAPLNRAFKVLDAKRLESARAFQAGTDRLAGMVAAGEGNEERIAVLQQDAAAAGAELEAAKAEIPGAEALATAAKEAVAIPKIKAAELDAQLRAQPNTEAAHQAAIQAHATFERTYQAGRAEKVKQHGDLKAQIASAEAELAAAQVPAAEDILALEGEAKAATSARDTTRAAAGLAATAMATATANLQAAAQAEQAAKSNLATAEASLAGLGALPDVPALEAAKTTAEAEEATANEACTKAIQAAMEARQAKKALTDKGEALMAEKATFAGKDVGKCSRCGQAIDSRHIESELARLDGEIALNATALTTATEDSRQADSVMVTANGTKTAAAAAAKAAVDAVHAAQLKAQAIQTQTLKVEQYRTMLAAAQADLITRQAESATAKEKQDALVAALAVEDAAARALVDRLEALRTTLQKVESTRGRLEALRGQMAALTEAGVREKAEYEAEIDRLRQAMQAAESTHASQIVLNNLLREQLEAARAQAETAAAASTAAALALQACKSKVNAAEERVRAIQSEINRITAQQAAVVQARFELGVMKERAEIDEIAAGLLDARNGLPVYLIDQALPFLEDRINFYLGKLGMERLTVTLSTLAEDKETLAILIDNGRPGPRLDVAAFSGGQLDRVECGMKCALADLARQTRGVTFGMVCFDEPSGGLNASGKEALIGLLYDRCDTYPVTILTSHDEALIRAFHSQIRFGQGPAEETVVVSSVQKKATRALELSPDLVLAA